MNILPSAAVLPNSISGSANPSGKIFPVRFITEVLLLRSVREQQKISCYAVRFASVRFGSVRFGSVRFGSLRFGSLRFASLRFGSLRFASLRFVSLRFASLRFASVRFASVRFASVRFASVRFGSFRFGSLRFGSLRFASLRFGSLRFVVISSYLKGLTGLQYYFLFPLEDTFRRWAGNANVVRVRFSAAYTTDVQLIPALTLLREPLDTSSINVPKTRHSE